MSKLGFVPKLPDAMADDMPVASLTAIEEQAAIQPLDSISSNINVSESEVATVEANRAAKQEAIKLEVAGIEAELRGLPESNEKASLIAQAGNVRNSADLDSLRLAAGAELGKKNEEEGKQIQRAAFAAIIPAAALGAMMQFGDVTRKYGAAMLDAGIDRVADVRGAPLATEMGGPGMAVALMKDTSKGQGASLPGRALPGANA